MEENNKGKEINNQETTVKKKKGPVRKILKVILWIFVGVIALNLLLYILLSIPAIQNKVVGFAVDKLKTQLNTEVSIDEIRLTLWGDISLRAKGVYIEDQAKDTLLYAHDLKAGISPLRLLNNKLLINHIDLDDFVINVNQKDSLSDYNFQFIINAFAGDTAVQDTTSSSMVIVLENIDIKRGRLNYDILSDTLSPGIFNPSHINVYDFNAKLDLNSIDPDKLDINLSDLSAKEKSGLEITSLKGKVYSEGTRFWAEGLSLSLPNSELAMEKANYDMGTDDFELVTDKAEIAPIDVIAFMPELKNLRNNISLNINASGKLPHIDLSNLEAYYGEEMRLKGNGFIGDYSQYGDTDINLFIENFKASPAAINDLAKLGDTTFVNPDILNDLGDVYLKGTIKGKLSKFNLDAETWAQPGHILLVGNGSIDTTFTHFNIIANASTRNFNLRRLLGPEMGLGMIGMNIDLKANQSGPETLVAEMRGVINGLQYMDSINLRNILFNGYYNPRDMGATVKADLPFGKLLANASMTQERVPDIKFDVNVDTLHVDEFYKHPTWKNPLLSFSLDGNIKGLDVDKMTGKVLLDSLDFRGENFLFQPGLISLELSQTSDTAKLIDIRSSILSAQVSGYYTFMTLADELSYMVYNYMPNVLPRQRVLRKPQNDFRIDMTIQNTEKLGAIFTLPANIVQPAKISGHINTIENQLDLNGNMPLIKYGDMEIANTRIDFSGVDSAFQGTVRTKLDMENGTFDIGLDTRGAHNTVHAKINAINSDTVFKMNGNIEAQAEFQRDEMNRLATHLKIYPTDLNVGKMKLQMLPSTVINTEDRTEINNFGIKFANSERKYVFVDGVISNTPNDSIRLSFDRSQVGDLLAAFNIDNIKAEIDGSIMLRKTENQPELLTQNFKISDIIIFSDTLGTLNIDSRWNRELVGIVVNSYLEKSNYDVATIQGIVYPRRDSIRMKIDVDRFPVGWAQPFVADMVNQLSGSVSMAMNLNGKLSAPRITGFLGLNDAAVGVEMTNVTYHISDSINIEPGHIGFRNLRVTDNEGNPATINATLTHQDFKNLEYNLDLRIPQRLMVLNTENRTDSLYYGRVYASGNANIKGNDRGIDITGRVKNENNSVINITVPQVSEAAQYKSVVYINVPEELRTDTPPPPPPPADPLPVRINLNLEVNPGFQAIVLVDPSTNMRLNVNGTGLVNFTYDMAADNMNVFGDYSIQQGAMQLTLQGLKTYEFNVTEGSKLKFLGDPMKTNFDITAYRRVRADLRTLSPTFEAEGTGRTTVDAVIGVKGNMDNMDLTYDVQLPDEDEDTQRRVNSIINTEDEKIRQFAYLLVTNSFYSQGGGGGNITDGMWTSLASSTLSGALNAMFGSILGNNWEIGTNFESNDGTFNDMDVNVNVSTRLFDDRLRLKTNVGYRNDAYGGSQSSFVGDFDVEYQLTKVWMLKAYSHTNDRYYRQAPTTQGVGIVYTKDAKTLKQLFQSFKPRRRNRNRQQNMENTGNSQTNSTTPEENNTIPPERQPATTNEKKE